MGQEHDGDGLTDNHAGSNFISELRIELEAELRKELDRLLEIFGVADLVDESLKFPSP